MSKLEVDKITPQSGTTLTIGDSGDTIVIDSTSVSGAKLAAPTLVGSASSAGSILFKEDTDNGTNAVTLIGPAATADVTLTLPAATDTVVGRQTTDTLTNKTINASQLVDGSIATGKLADDAVTYAKMQDTSTANRVLGAASAGTISEVQIATDMIADDAVTADKLANSINSAITANTAKVTNATHSGEVTGATALTIADNIVDEANLKVSNSAVNGYVLSAQSGNTGGLTWVEAGGGDYVKLASQTVNVSDTSVSGVSFDGIFDDTTYASYYFVATGYRATATNNHLMFRWRRSNSDVTASQVNMVSVNNGFANNASGGENYNPATGYGGRFEPAIRFSSYAVTTTSSSFTGNYNGIISNTTSTDFYKNISFNCFNHDGSYMVTASGAGVLKETTAVNGCSFYADNSGSIKDLTLAIYGIKK